MIDTQVIMETRTARLHELGIRRADLFAVLSFGDIHDDKAWQHTRETLAQLVEVQKEIIRELTEFVEEVKE